MWNDAESIANTAFSKSVGLNFKNFVDCLARIALVGYSAGNWVEMFPSSKERIEAMFLTQMALLDNNLMGNNVHTHQQNQGLASAKFEGFTKLSRIGSRQSLLSKTGSFRRNRGDSVASRRGSIDSLDDK